MSDRARRVWRAAPATLVVVSVFALLAAGAVSALAYLVYRAEADSWIPVALGVLALAALFYAWRFGLHPRLRADDQRVEIRNPFSSVSVPWDDIAVIAPGENGLVIASEDLLAEAWCVQKSNWSTRRGRFTRADAVAHELIDLLEQHDPPLVDEQSGLRIRRARPDESRLLTRIERAASEQHLDHLFPPEQHPYPVQQITTRWRRLLRDPLVRVFVLDRADDPLGFVAFSRDQVLQLGVLPHQTRRGYGSALLGVATREIFDNGTREARLWVLVGDQGARAFFRHHGWAETLQRRRSSYPPRPDELRMSKPNPALARRSS